MTVTTFASNARTVQGQWVLSQNYAIAFRSEAFFFSEGLVWDVQPRVRCEGSGALWLPQGVKHHLCVW